MFDVSETFRVAFKNEFEFVNNNDYNERKIFFSEITTKAELKDSENERKGSDRARRKANCR